MLHALVGIDDSGLNQPRSARASLFSAEDKRPQRQKSKVYRFALSPNRAVFLKGFFLPTPCHWPLGILNIICIPAIERP
jgi:hypothetical protein